MRIKIFVILLAALGAWTGTGLGQGCFYDDASFFTGGVWPNAMILLDRTGSMCWRPQDTTYPCADGTNPAVCGQNGYGNQAKIGLAVKAIFYLLDADSNGVVQDQDSLALKVRLGYGHYYNSSGENSGIAVPYNGCNIGTSYSTIWSNAQTQVACQGTPLNHANWHTLDLVRTTHRAEAPIYYCRKSFAIVITDGEDTYGCGGTGSNGSPASRRAGVNVCYSFANPSYWEDSVKTFVIGFGSNMPAFLQNELNWMAYGGGTNNPMVPDSGNPGDYNPRNDGITTYQTCDNRAVADPGSCFLRGYAFIARDSSQLRAALRSIFASIQQSSGSSFSPPSVPANFTYTSMLLVNNFDAVIYPQRWKGHLMGYGFYGTGDIPILPAGGLDPARFKWDAGTLLRQRNLGTNPRTLLTPLTTLTGYTLRAMDDTLSSGGYIRPESLGLASTAAGWDSLRKIVNYLYYDSTNGANKFGWLGDPFHAGPIDVGPPNPYFSTDTLFNDFVYYWRTDSLTRRPRRVYLQTNDGMLHQFNGDSLVSHGGGRELCAIVPRHVRPRLREMLYGHTYYLDGAILSTHVLDSTLNNPNLTEWQDWRTILICAERSGGRFYYAVDVNNAGTPQYLWECGPDSANGDTAMGYTFGRATVCRMKDGGVRRYVAFLPGGFDCDRIGRGNFVLAVDAYSGRLIRKIPLPGGAYGMAAQVRPVDINYDGYVDRLYVGDVAGHMWRIILDNPETNAGWHARCMFRPDSTSRYNRPIYGQVSVAIDYQSNLWIYWGTGDRNQPTDPPSQNRNAFFGIQDRDTGATINQTDAVIRNVTTSICQNADRGWYVDLYRSPTNFLEVFTNPVTVSDTVRVLGWVPSGSQQACVGAGAGTDSLYSMYYLCGSPTQRRAEEVGSGIPPYELGWGVDRRGNVTALMPNLTKKLLGVLARGKYVRTWREVY